MALKQKHTIESGFSMASMTDVIFLLLIFFMIISTIVVPNAIKFYCPKHNNRLKLNPHRVTIDADMRYYIASGGDMEREVPFEAITPFLQSSYSEDPNIFVALYADESVPYREIVRILDIANQHKFKMVLMTRPN